MIKKIFLSFCSVFLLSWCFGGDSEIGTSGLTLFENKNFSLMIPSWWETIALDNISIPKPNRGDVELVGVSKERKYGMRNNIIVLSEPLWAFASSQDFSRLNQVWAESDYLDYSKIESKEFIFEDKIASSIHIFHAKYNFETPKLTFMQLWRVCEQDRGYLITIALPADTKSTSKYEDFLSTFRCKEKVK